MELQKEPAGKEPVEAALSWPVSCTEMLGARGRTDLSAALSSGCLHGNMCQPAEKGLNESLETILVLNVSLSF